MVTLEERPAQVHQIELIFPAMRGLLRLREGCEQGKGECDQVCWYASVHGVSDIELDGSALRTPKNEKNYEYEAIFGRFSGDFWGFWGDLSGGFSMGVEV